MSTSPKLDADLGPPYYCIAHYGGSHLRMRFFKDDGNGGRVDMSAWTSPLSGWSSGLGEATHTVLASAVDVSGEYLVVDVTPVQQAAIGPIGYFEAGLDNDLGQREVLGRGEIHITPPVIAPS